ncbi:hypothetical protein ACN2C6_19245 (plasmid) [Caulobacter sp. ErkDOM-YI]|uniref:hypothetical protein n=1 Tax=unclassified Caulobacter TaxID=2648921 RepID=UPI003AF5CDB6
MSWVLDPVPSDVKALDDVALRELVRRLCEAEMKAMGLSPAGLIAGGHQKAKDGGIDVRVEGEGAGNGYLPRLPLGFQVKATTMDKADVDKEMRFKGVLRSSIITLGQDDGAYIIACGHENLTGMGREERVRAMRLAFGGCETPAPHFDFYDASRLADWARQHRSVAIWLLEKAGRSTRGWADLANWSAPDQGLEPVFLADDQARLTVGANTSARGVVEGLDALRNALRRPRSVVRLLGQSGMGKTRLVQALFDERVGEQALPAHLAVYGDAGDPDMEVAPTAMARALIDADQAPILIVDNCPTQMHSLLTAIASRPEAKFSLLTIDFDIGADQPDKTVVARLEAGGDVLIERLLRQRAPHLNAADVRRVVEFSEGNTRIALALAKTAATSGSLANLEDAALVDRLFLTGRRGHDPKLHQVARIAALVYAFYVEGDPNPDELAVLAGLAGTSETDFLDRLGELLDRGLAQQRGKQRAILPQALAIHLAKDAVARIPASRLFAIFSAAPARLATSFAKRLGALHDRAEAVAMAEMILAPGQELARPSREDKAAIEVLAHLAPLAPARVLGILQDYVARYGATETIVYTNQAARQITALLCKLTYEAELFDPAARLLSQLVIGQDESRMIEQLRPRFTRLFQAIMSDTEALPEQRFALLDDLLASQDAPTRLLGLHALRAALMTRPNNRSSIEPFGARRRTAGWWATGDKQVLAWFTVALDRAFGMIVGAEPVMARTILAKAYPDLVRIAAIDAQTVETMIKVADLAFWGEGWFAACDVLNHRKGDDQTQAMRDCEAALRPKTLQEQFDAFMRQRLWDWHDPDGDDAVDSWNTARARARQVGGDAFAAGDEGKALLTVALSDPHVAGSEFGAGWAQAAQDLDQAWADLLIQARAVPRGDLNATTIAGFFGHCRQAYPAVAERWLEAGVSDPLVASLLPWLEVESGEVGEAGIARMITVLTQGLVHEGVAQTLWRFKASADVAPDALAALVDAVLDHGQPSTALHLLDAKRPKADEEAWPQALRAAGRRILEAIAFSNDEGRSGDYQLAALADRVLGGSEGEATAAGLLTRIAKHVEEDNDFWLHGLPGLMGVIARDHPRLVLDTYLSTTWDHVRYKLDHLLKNYDDDDGGGFNLIAAIASDVLMSWMDEDRLDRGRRLAQLIPYFETGEGKDFAWTPLAMRLLNAVGGDEEVHETFERRFGTGASSGEYGFRYRRRLAMLRGLGNHQNPAVRKWADDFHRSLVKYLTDLEAGARKAEPTFE